MLTFFIFIRIFVVFYVEQMTLIKMINYYNIMLFLISVLIILQFSLTIVCVYYFRIFSARVFNNTEYELSRILYEELSGLGNETSEEQALWSYFRQKANDVFSKYRELRDKGIHRMRSDTFENDLLGSVQIDLLKNYNFNKSFVEIVKKANKHNYNQFTTYMYADISKIKGKNGYLLILKNNTLLCFRKNVKMIFEAWEKQYKTIPIILETTETDLFTFESSVTINKDKLKEQVGGSENNILNVLQILQKYSSKDNENENTIIQFLAQYNEYRKNKYFSIDNQADVNRLRMNILEFIDNL